MIYRFLAELVLVLHFGFVLFVVLGGVLVLRWPSLLWLHLPGICLGHPGTVFLLDLPAYAA